MITAYIRVSTDQQSIDNQKYEVLKYCDEKKINIDNWIEETIKKLLAKKISISAIARLLDVNRRTVSNFIKSRKRDE